jgi:hypothetical protein
MQTWRITEDIEDIMGSLNDNLWDSYRLGDYDWEVPAPTITLTADGNIDTKPIRAFEYAKDLFHVIDSHFIVLGEYPYNEDYSRYALEWMAYQEVVLTNAVNTADFPWDSVEEAVEAYWEMAQEVEEAGPFIPDEDAFATSWLSDAEISSGFDPSKPVTWTSGNIVPILKKHGLEYAYNAWSDVEIMIQPPLKWPKFEEIFREYVQQ